MKPALRPAFLLPALAVAASTFGADHAPFTRTEDVVYGRKFGTALTLDVFEPAPKNGAAVLWIISGSFISDHDKISPKLYQPLLDHGYTVFAVVPGCRPRFIVPEMVDDIQRAVRFVRHQAARWQVDPQKLGLSGSSAGGFLALSVGTRGGPGAADAADPVDRESSAVEAVACFYPPTDLVNFSRPGELMWDHVSHPSPHTPAIFFSPDATTPEAQRKIGAELSPINHVKPTMPPTLVYQGDADQMVPIFQARAFEQKCREVGAPFKLVIKPGAAHGNGFGDHLAEVAAFATWYDRHLLAK